MDAEERRHEHDRLTALEAVLVGIDRRHEVIDAMWSARDRDDARRRVSEALGLESEIASHVIVDLQLARLTATHRADVTADIATLRARLGS